MQTIIIILNPAKLENPDLDLRYCIPDRIEEVSNGTIQDNGYDYIDTEEGQPGPLMGIWLKTESASENWSIIKKLFQVEKFKENDLSLSAEILISENDTEDIENCTLVFPTAS
ncbi:MAG: hypothetical protein K2M60_02215 [Lachnospiraceae bacterium]|nr:hypothetical protein [Lachnospiraceae bacterium]MDE6251400.1 hypothetical protein [Lachnospiraceae bacterium]